MCEFERSNEPLLLELRQRANARQLGCAKELRQRPFKVLEALPPTHVGVLRHRQRLAENGSDRSEFFGPEASAPGDQRFATANRSVGDRMSGIRQGYGVAESGEDGKLRMKDRGKNGGCDL